MSIEELEKKEPESEEKTSKKSNSKASEEIAVSFEEIMNKASKVNAGTSAPAKVLYECFISLKSVNALDDQQIDEFFNTAKEKLADSFVPYLVKISIMINPYKMGNDLKLSTYVIEKSESLLEQYGIGIDIIEPFLLSFATKKEGSVIRDCLNLCERIINKPTQAQQQELARLTFVLFSLNFRKKGDHYFDKQVILDRVITEYLTKNRILKNCIRDIAGKALCGIISLRRFSYKKLFELQYQYYEYEEKNNLQHEKILELEAIKDDLTKSNISLLSDLENEKQTNEELQRRIEDMEASEIMLIKEKNDACNLLDFEMNKSEKLLSAKEAAVVRELTENLELDFQAVRELVQCLSEADQERITRRLDRIDMYLKDFGGK